MDINSGTPNTNTLNTGAPNSGTTNQESWAFNAGTINPVTLNPGSLNLETHYHGNPFLRPNYSLKNFYYEPFLSPEILDILNYESAVVNLAKKCLFAY